VWWLLVESLFRQFSFCVAAVRGGGDGDADVVGDVIFSTINETAPEIPGLSAIIEPGLDGVATGADKVWSISFFGGPGSDRGEAAALAVGSAACRASVAG